MLLHLIGDNMKIKGLNVFISGPMSGIEHYNVGEFAKAHAICKEAGAEAIYDPAYEYLHGRESASHKEWLRRCISTLTMASHVSYKPFYEVLVQLPGWEDSEGAKTEATVADACGIQRIALEDVE